MVLITGGSGFFGQQVALAFLAQGERVRILDVQDIDDPAFAAQVEFVKGDVCDAEIVTRAMQGIDTLYHNASVLPIAKAGKGYEDINVGGTRVVLEAAQAAGVRRIIYTSSSAPYGIPAILPLTEESPFAPIEAYGRSKRRAEEVCEEFRAKGLNISIARPRTISGPGRLGIFSILFDWIHSGKAVYILGNGKNRFQFLDGRDLVDAFVLLKDKGDNEDFNFGAKEYGTLKEGLEVAIARAGTSSRVITLPALPGKIALRILDWTGLSPLVAWHYETLDKPFYFDISKAERILGWQPRYSNTQSIVDSYEWYLTHREGIEGTYGKTHNKPLKQLLLRVLRSLS